MAPASSRITADRVSVTITWALIGVLLQAAGAYAQGTIKGVVEDDTGGILPGVTIVASSPTLKRVTVTNESGQYEISGLPDGTYSVTTDLPGFMKGTRESIRVAANQTVDRIDFSLCQAAPSEIDYVLRHDPQDLVDIWRESQVIAYVRISATGFTQPHCSSGNFLHTAEIVETFKNSIQPRNGRTVVFRQEWSSDEPRYAVGQRIVVFLRSGGRGELFTYAGPYFTFLVKENQIITGVSPYREMPAEAFLRKLRDLAKSER